ncbi:hypothetical protein LINPERPRIM_LOCUS44135 [Linum perenne]
MVSGECREDHRPIQAMAERLELLSSCGVQPLRSSTFHRQEKARKFQEIR